MKLLILTIIVTNLCYGIVMYEAIKHITDHHESQEDDFHDFLINEDFYIS